MGANFEIVFRENMRWAVHMIDVKEFIIIWICVWDHSALQWIWVKSPVPSLPRLNVQNCYELKSGSLGLFYPMKKLQISWT